MKSGKSSKTSGNLLKTPGLFEGSVDEPSFGNDYTLMTPGLEATGPFSKWKLKRLKSCSTKSCFLLVALSKSTQC